MTRVCVTGGNGFLGSAVVARLAEHPDITHVLSLDIREPAPERRLDGVAYALADVCSPEVARLLAEHRIDTVVHLAAIVNPGKSTTREQEYRVDVDGSRNVLAACIAAGVKHVIISSSGAAYGYHPDNSPWLTEADPIRGNDEFAYSQHKRLVEEELARVRAEHPELKQTVFRIGTILGERVRNQITALLDAPRLLRVAGSESPFVFVWDEDVAGVMVQAAVTGRSGIYNVAGDGALTVREIAALQRRGTITVPAPVLAAALWLGSRLWLTVHGPERVRFLRYRPVLDNRALKEEFGYTPGRTSREAFLAFRAAREAQEAGEAQGARRRRDAAAR
ncbi:SDR family oxidoreductase [Arthrobacter zhangbolii]|uniref:SDR family oxidoreductase n=1 Tax=Arthrobacter zhangbolii TaxID=2886936 RepID=A0A9X1M526_9MICC|nr:SDR family oxidoreductase [Arthrobacter zhangbolii]MCC3271401.1 SDR family oxidoreductase [Arthrobacter zhangbolii]UON90821.1 SDR family oxidoreductase [Arthrobacter zhangbolii]